MIKILKKINNLQKKKIKKLKKKEKYYIKMIENLCSTMQELINTINNFKK